MSILKLQGKTELASGVYYEVDTTSSPLGSGGMGTVYPALRVDSNGIKREAAVKFLYSDLPEAVIKRARQEASIQIKNDNLVEMYGFIETRNLTKEGKEILRYHVASELLHGVMLFDLLNGQTTDQQGKEIGYARELVDKMNSNREEFAYTIVLSILSGVMALHDAGYAHRDIDPSNIMVTADRKIKLIDFGIVKNLSDKSPNLSMAGQFLGKPAYAAPEIVNGYINDQNKTTDIYSIGILFYELLTGHLPFEGTSDEVIEKQKKELIPISEFKNPDIINVIQKATAKKQRDRYQTAAEFRVDIEHLLSGTSIKTNVHTSPVPSKNIGMPHWAIWLIIIVAGLFCGCIFALL